MTTDTIRESAERLLTEVRLYVQEYGPDADHPSFYQAILLVAPAALASLDMADRIATLEAENARLRKQVQTAGIVLERIAEGDAEETLNNARTLASDALTRMSKVE